MSCEDQLRLAVERNARLVEALAQISYELENAVEPYIIPITDSLEIAQEALRRETTDV